MDKAQKICEQNVLEIKKVYGIINEYEDNNKNLCTTIEKSNLKMQNNITKVLKETRDKQNKLSFAETVKKGSVLPEFKKQVPLIIKPKEKQKIEKTKEELNNKVNPSDFKITRVENRSNGTLVIHSENNEEREKIKSAIQNKMSENYDIKVPSNNEMSVVITDMSFKYSDTELIEKMKKQNDIIKDINIKILKTFETKRKNIIIYNAKILIDNESYTKLLSTKKINIGWEKCRIFDGTEVIMCYKCKGFNHKARDCRNEEVCYRCHGNHKPKECTEEVIVKCINCIRSNQKFNLGLDENHSTTNKECPVYQNKLKIKMRMIGFNI